MHQLLEFFLKHVYLVIFLSVLAEQIGLPIPTIPLLLTLGALASRGKLYFALGLALCITAALIADLIWYTLGRKKGAAILRLLCRISLEPDSCVRQTENQFLRYGPKALLFAKFVPGLSAAFPPMSGMFRMPLWKFVVFDGLGALAWSGTYITAGFIFRDQVDQVLSFLSRMGSWVLLFIASILAAYILYKWIQRRRFIGKLRVARIEVRELATMLERGEEVTILDLRNVLERENHPMRVPGSILVSFEDLDAGRVTIPTDRDVVLYCT